MSNFFEHPGPVNKLTWADRVADQWHLLPDSIHRSVRTFVQAFVGLLLVTVVAEGGVDQLWSWNILEPALVAGVIAVLTFAHTTLDASSKGVDTR